MGKFLSNSYKKDNVDRQWLKQNDFRYSRTYSDSESDAYLRRFPVYKYGSYCTLEGEVLIYVETGEVKINVYESGTNDIYAPFYHVEYGNYDSLLKIIDKYIYAELKRLNIRKVKTA